jgi:hypothetical protein
MTGEQIVREMMEKLGIEFELTQGIDGPMECPYKVDDAEGRPIANPNAKGWTLRIANGDRKIELPYYTMPGQKDPTIENVLELHRATAALQSPASIFKQNLLVLKVFLGRKTFAEIFEGEE